MLLKDIPLSFGMRSALLAVLAILMVFVLLAGCIDIGGIVKDSDDDDDSGPIHPA